MGRRYVRGGLPVLLAVALVALAVPVPSAGASGTTSGPVLALTLAPSSGPAPLQVSLLATLTPSTTAAVFNWSFGDGTSYQVSAVGSSDPVHQFLLPGQYLVEVTATTSTGVLEANQVVDVGPAALEVQISTSRDTGP
ncbi:MAG TPA: PKD domain-containing protein, partial [Acidimicrobiales bacterium]|nr:PKD domain-containing protein [Acidimicrobiales bacterium]